MVHDHLCVTLVPLFNHLDIDDQITINDLVKDEVYKKGELVLSPDQSPRLIIVASGSIKLYQLSSGGNEQLLRIAEPGDFEGANQLFGATNENLFAETLTETKVCVLQQSDFQQLLMAHPQLMMKLLAINAEKTTKLEQQAQFLMMEKVEERLATYLLDLAKISEKNIVQVPMKMKELAAFLGTTPETLSRKFKLLEELDIIQRKGKTIEILDIDELEDI